MILELTSLGLLTVTSVLSDYHGMLSNDKPHTTSGLSYNLSLRAVSSD